MLRTSVNAPWMVLSVTVRVRPPSKAYGTSTPSFSRPSERLYFTWYCVSVMKFADVGAVGDEAVPGSFMPSDSETRPTSLKTVGTLFTTVRTSDARVPPNFVGSDPGAASSALTIRNEEAVPSRCMSPHAEAAEASSRTAAPRAPQAAQARADDTLSLSVLMATSPSESEA